jgi:hypothetical protein
VNRGEYVPFFPTLTRDDESSVTKPPPAENVLWLNAKVRHNRAETAVFL